jgi:hypothetical protein
MHSAGFSLSIPFCLSLTGIKTGPKNEEELKRIREYGE